MRRVDAPIALLLPSLRRIHDSLVVSLADMDAVGDLDGTRLGHLTQGERATLDAFLRRFEMAVEGGRRLLRGALDAIGENEAGLSVWDVQNKAEKFGLIGSAADWRYAVEVRNEVAHEYSMSLGEAAGAIGKALRQARYVAAALGGALEALERPPFSEALRQQARS